jgi:hypothetical protein
LKLARHYIYRRDRLDKNRFRYFSNALDTIVSLLRLEQLQRLAPGLCFIPGCNAIFQFNTNDVGTRGQCPGKHFWFQAG